MTIKIIDFYSRSTALGYRLKQSEYCKDRLSPGNSLFGDSRAAFRLFATSLRHLFTDVASFSLLRFVSCWTRVGMDEFLHRPLAISIFPKQLEFCIMQHEDKKNSMTNTNVVRSRRYGKALLMPYQQSCIMLQYHQSLPCAYVHNVLVVLQFKVLTLSGKTKTKTKV